MLPKVKQLTSVIVVTSGMLALFRLFSAPLDRQSQDNNSNLRVLETRLEQKERQAVQQQKWEQSEFIKRVFDVTASTVAIILILPVLVTVTAIIRMTSPGSILYRAQRVGRDGRPFRLYKFRSMVANADRMGPGITTADDPRITSIGAMLRATKLDELPQFFNVLLGDMSLVGPRPEDPRYVQFYTDEQRSLLARRPGITSPASILMRNEAKMLNGDDWETAYINEVLPQKLAVDLAYFEQASFWSDLHVLLDTFRCVLRN